MARGVRLPSVPFREFASRQWPARPVRRRRLLKPSPRSLVVRGPQSTPFEVHRPSRGTAAHRRFRSTTVVAKRVRPRSVPRCWASQRRHASPPTSGPPVLQSVRKGQKQLPREPSGESSRCPNLLFRLASSTRIVRRRHAEFGRRSRFCLRRYRCPRRRIQSRSHRLSE